VCVCVSCSTRYIGRTFKEKEANTELQNPDRGFWVLRVVNGGIAKGVSLVFE
jgi:hypothetical protein